MAENQYPFLELRTPKDTTASSLNNKVAHSIYQAIVRKTTIQNAKSSSLFTTDTKVDGVALVSKQDYSVPIKRLIEDKLVQQLFFFVSSNQRIEIQTCYIAVPLDKSVTMKQIYDKLLESSIQNIEYFLDFQLDFDPDEFKSELEKNAKESLPLTEENYPNSLIQIFSAVENPSNEIPLDGQIVQTITKEIEEELVTKKKLIKVESKLYIPVSKDLAKERFEIADQFIKTNFRPNLDSDSANEIASINRDEEIYNLTPFHEIDVSFQVRRARIFHNLVYKPGLHYPGELAILNILLLENQVTELLRKYQEERILNETESLKNKFHEYSENWRSILHFLGDDVIESRHPKVWENLKNDKTLAFTEWCLKKEEILVFTERRAMNFVTIIKSMDQRPPSSSWQILAFKQLLENYEKVLPGIFINKDVLKMYGNLLRTAYVDYFPWFYQVLIIFDFFKDIFFRNAKQKILHEQESYRRRILKFKMEKEKKRIQEKLTIQELKNNEKIRNEIIEALEEFYFTENKVPTVSQIMQKCKIKDTKQFQAILHRECFQMIPLIKGGGFENIAVLFPLDHTWRKKEAKLKKILYQKIEAYTIDPPKDKNEVLPYRLLYNHILSQSRKMLEEYSENEESEETEDNL